MARKTNQPPSPEPDEPKMTGTLVGGGLALLLLAGWMGWEFYTAAGSLVWPPAEGTVKTLKVWDKVPLGGGKKLVQVEISYDYTVNGQTSTGQTFNSRNNHIDESAVGTVRQRYAPGARCQVAYSPLFPAQSVLVREVPATAWGKLGIGLVALAGAAYLLCHAFQMPEPASAAASPRAGRR